MKLLFLFLLLPKLVFAGPSGLSECGEYTIRGIVRALPDGVTIVVNEKTQSELKIAMPIFEQSKIGGHINKPVTIKALLRTQFDGTKGFTEKIISSEFRLPNPLNPQDTGLSLDKKVDCKKGL